VTGKELEKRTKTYEGAFEHENSGLHMSLYRNSETGKYALAFRGTQPTSVKDIAADLNQGLGSDEQYRQAMRLSARVVQALGSANVTMVGHSLGGGLASTAAIHTGTKGVT